MLARMLFGFEEPLFTYLMAGERTSWLAVCELWVVGQGWLAMLARMLSGFGQDEPEFTDLMAGWRTSWLAGCEL